MVEPPSTGHSGGVVAGHGPRGPDSALEPLSRAGVEFTAACPCGHPDAAWRTFLREAPGASADDYLADQLPHYRVECSWCGTGPDDEVVLP